MKQPYENVYLGNFIFALGFQAAKTRTGLCDKAVQLVQQTPDEAKLNDLFLSWSGKSYIFEFKRNKDKIVTELNKAEKKLLNEALNKPENERIRDLANKSHFLGFGLNDDIHFTYYSAIHKEIDRVSTLSNFCALILNDDHDTGLSHDELTDYLKFIGDVTNSSSEGCGGFIVNISNDGSINMVPFESVQILAKALDIKPAPPEPPASTRSFGMGR
jgi:hypothetical protein